VEQSRLGLEDSRISMLGTRNNLLPTLSVSAGLSNSGLAGSVNNVPGFPRTAADVNGFFLGGFGSVLNQIFSRNFPNYNAGITLSVPLRNRATQADLITDELNYRQSQIQDKQLQNTIKLNVINAQTALRQARAAYETAIVTRQLQERTLAGERRKYELGSSSLYAVVQVQRDTTTRELAEVDALRQYMQARTALDNVMGRTLEVEDVDIVQAKTGVVGREPDLIVPPAK
jgi:outer membrane protein TolC